MQVLLLSQTSKMLKAFYMYQWNLSQLAETII